MGALVPLLAGGTAGLLTYAMLSPGSQLMGRTIVAGRDPREVALTYDDGPNAAAAGAGTEALLDVLASHNARATFFMLGKFVRERPELARRVHAAGHLIGNHTMTHPWLHTKSERVIRRELTDCKALLEDVLGAPVRYFRPPHGARRGAVIRIACELGMATVQWNAMGQDWRPIGAESILHNIERGLNSAQRAGRGANILLHDGGDRAMGTSRADTVRATERLLQRFAQEGRRIVTVDAWDWR
jgi:peptidoglycan/xylan/chitin deacetylase (PgdA/CDA1 family)